MKNIFLLIFLLTASCALSQDRRGNTGNNPRDIADTTKRASKVPEVDCGWDLEYHEDEDIVLHKKSLAPFTGMCRTYYEDNRLEREAQFVDGKEDGISMTYYQRFILQKLDDGNMVKMRDTSAEATPGQRWTQTSFKMGVPHGEWRFWYENGTLAWLQIYKDGLKDGTWEYYYDNKNPKKIINYKEDKKNGEYIEYFANGKEKLVMNYKDDFQDGKYVMNYDTGDPFIQGTYKQGKEDGEFVSYYKNKQVSSIRRYIMGKPEGTWYTYFEDGKEKSKGSFKAGQKIGEHYTYFKEGQIRTKEVYVAGKLTLREEFDEFGNKIEKGTGVKED
jgi:uncharacterized protein